MCKTLCRLFLSRFLKLVRQSGLRMTRTTMLICCELPRNPAFLSVKATLKHLTAYTAEFAPEALDELASYLLSWVATVTPFEMLSAKQLRLAAASNQEALQTAQTLFCKQQKDALTFTTARPVLVQNLCDAITRTGKRHKEALLVNSIVRHFFSELPLRRLVILLERLLPLLQSTATPGTPLLQASRKTAGSKTDQSASCTLWQASLLANTPCGTLRCLLRSVAYTTFSLPFGRLSRLWSISILSAIRSGAGLMETHASHLEPSFSWLRRMTRCLHKGCVAQHKLRRIHAIRRLHSFTIAMEPIELPAGS